MFKTNSVICYLSKVNKTWKKGKSLPSFELRGFEKAELCVIRCLKQYLLITYPLRREKITQLLIIVIRPHNPVSTDTVSC